MKEKEDVNTSCGSVDSGCCGHNHGGHNHSEENTNFKIYLPAIISFVMLVVGLVLDSTGTISIFKGWVRLVWYGVAYFLVGLPVLKSGFKSIQKGDFFTEFLLMSIATIGAFALGEYPEGVAVMVFYSVGELFQHTAVEKARGNIKALLDIRPNKASVFRANNFISVPPEAVKVGEKIQVLVGEKIPLDGILLSDRTSLNTAAITGESNPRNIQQHEKVFAGSINLERVIEVETTKEFKDSSIAQILDLVQNATARKSKTELFIRKFARIYTPIVTFSAIAVTLLPYFFISDYVFGEWLYRALIFLVISCPCALVISIPLGYFGGLGAASRNGILFKGASFLDTITKIDRVVMDKTGTVTKGVFKIKEIKTFKISENDLMRYLLAMESKSTHPIAKALLNYNSGEVPYVASNVSEVQGKGLVGIVNDKTVMVGNKALMEVNNINVPKTLDAIVETVVAIAIENVFAGYVSIADELKDDAQVAIQNIKNAGVSKVMMLSGDKDTITQKVAKELKIDCAKGGLLPEDKLNEVEVLKKKEHKVAFVGDGINDAPVLATSDIGIAMGGLGSDVAIETADVIIQTDQPSKIATAIKIGKSTRQIVWQNIALAFGVKFIVLFLGVIGFASMWGAVFADVGVALLAILNAVRLQNMNWNK